MTDGKTYKLTAKQEAFSQAIAAGSNQSDAYRTAFQASRNWKPEAVWAKASALAAVDKVRVRIEELKKQIQAPAIAAAGLSLERTLKEIARLAYADPRKFYNADGSLKQITELDDDTAATVASMELEEIKEQGVVIGVTRKVKQWDKKAALDMAMKHLGGYEKDNAQASPTVILQVTKLDEDL